MATLFNFGFPAALSLLAQVSILFALRVEMAGGLLETGYQQIQTIRYSELASSVIILYDHLVTLDLEIDLIWRSGWSFGKCLFLVNRYYTLFVVLFNNYVLFSPNLNDKLLVALSSQGSHWFQWQGSTGVVAFILGELILQLRLYALYSLDKRVLVLMAVTFTSAVAASSTLMGTALARIKATSHPVPGITFCDPINLPGNFYAFWIPMLISESLLCGLALWRGLQNHLRRRKIYQSGRQLIGILIRDSCLYFLVLFAVYFCNTIIFIFGNKSQLESAIGYSVAMSCVMGNRLCLNVRGMVRPEVSLRARDELHSMHHHQRRPTLLSSDQTTSKRSPAEVVVDASSSVGTVSRTGVLSEYELDELRGMRAARVV